MNNLHLAEPRPRRRTIERGRDTASVYARGTPDPVKVLLFLNHCLGCLTTAGGLFTTLSDSSVPFPGFKQKVCHTLNFHGLSRAYCQQRLLMNHRCGWLLCVAARFDRPTIITPSELDRSNQGQPCARNRGRPKCNRYCAPCNKACEHCSKSRLLNLAEAFTRHGRKREVHVCHAARSLPLST